MASNLKASASVDILTLNKSSVSTISEGGACAFHTDFDQVTAVSGAAAVKVMGIVTNAGGVVSGDRTNVQVIGVANVLMAASQTITQGDEIITSSATGGTCKSWVNETAVDVIGIAQETRVIGAAAELVPVLLRMYRRP